MNDELFPAESVAQDSPRLAWMKRHDIHTDKMHDYDEEEEPWSAWVGDLEKAIADGGDNPEAGGYSVAKTEDDALAILAKARGLRLWNEEEAQ